MGKNPNGKLQNNMMRFFNGIIGSLLLISITSYAQDWPEFRGPYGNGHATADDAKPAGLPLHWSETENVKWKTPIPYRGLSTPVVMGPQVWLTTATEDGHDFYILCLDANTGQVQFNEKIFHSDHPERLGNNVNSYATPSPAIEPGRVYVHFGSYGTACLDTATCKPIWERTDLPCRHFRGPASSLILFENLLILTMDGIDVQYTVALDKKTGQTVWKTDRTTPWDDLGPDGQSKLAGDLRKSFCTPLIAEWNGNPIMISPGSKEVFTYDPRSGREIWKAWTGSINAAPRPVFSQGMFLFITGQGKPELWAMKPDGQGDVAQSNVVWKSNKSIPKNASPVVVGDLLFMVNDDGAISCLEVATGNQLWKEMVGGPYTASPIYADGRLYFFDQKGVVTVIKPGRTYEVLASNTLETGGMASPAVSGKALFLRTKTHLYRIESSGPEVQ